MTKPKKKPDARRAEVRRLEVEFLHLLSVWLVEHCGDSWFEGTTGKLEYAITKLRAAKARAGK